MRLYLLRHGHSPGPAEAGVASDADRPVSERGLSQVRQVVGRLLKEGARPSLILHSPLRRARETAQAAAELLKPASAPEPFLPLSNAMPAGDLYEHLKIRAKSVPEVLAVGHQPQLGELALFLTNRLFELHPGGLIAIETMKEGGARTLWSVNPLDIREP